MIVVINKKEKQMAFNTHDNIFLEMAEILNEDGLSGLELKLKKIRQNQQHVKTGKLNMRNTITF